MKKHLFLKSLLIAIGLLIASINTAWAGTYTVVGVAMDNANNYYPRISVNTGGGDGCGWWDWCFNSGKAGITFEGKKLYLAEWTDCWNGTDNLYFQQYTTDCGTEKNYNEVHTSYTKVEDYHTKIWNYNESNSKGGSWYSTLTMGQSKVYFDATGWSETDIDLCIAHMNYQAYYGMTHVANTKLYYTNESYSWADAMGFGVVGGHSRPDGKDANGYYWITDVSDYSAEYTGFKHTALNNNDANYAYLVVNAGKAGQQPTVSSNSSYATLLNSTQTIKSYVSEDYGSSYDNANSKATITITSYAMTSQGASGATASNGSLSTSAKSTTVTSARTATTTLSVGTVADGYVFVGWYDGSGNALPDDGDGDLYTYTYYPTGATEVRAYFKNEVSHPVTISNYCTTNSTTISSTSRSIGESTPVPITAPGIDDHTFVNWTLGSGMTNHSANVNANPISVTTAGAGTYTLRANYTLVPCTLWYHTSSATFADKTGQIIMSYDLEEDAYYADVASTPSSPYYFRFYHNGATQYSAAWDGSSPNVQSAVPNGSKITCDQNVNSWGTKSSIKYVGNSGTAIRIWFDYKNKEAWITADKDKQYVLRGSTYADTKVAGGMPGWDATTTYFNGLASGNTGTVTATLSAYTKYCLKVYDRYSDTWYGYSTNNTEYELINNTLATTGTGTNNNFYFTTTAAGTYTFTVDKSSGLKVKVDYPTAYTVTYYNKFRDIDGTITEATTGGSISGMSGSASGAQASGKYFNNTETVTLTHSTANGGYSWIGWYNSEACNSAYSTGGNVSISDASRTIALSNLAANTKVAALYAEVGTTVTLANDGHGHVEIGGATVTSTTVGKTTSRTIVAVNSTGYHFNAWTATSGTDYTIGNTGNASTTLTGKGSGSSSQTVTATFTANSYSVRFNRNGGTGGDEMDNQAFTYDAAQNLTECSFSMAGYSFGGWAISPEDAAAGTKTYNDKAEVSNLTGENGGTFNLYAIWTPNPYTITLDVDETNKGTFTGATGSVTATYDATLPSIGGTLPVAANGYRYMGMYTAANGGGVALTDSLNNWLSNVTDYISSGKWVHVGDVELYAYYKKAEVIRLVLDPSTQAPGEDVTATPTIYPKPEGTVKLCWKILRSNGNLLTEDGFTPGEGNAVSFDAPSASGSYIVKCVLRTGSSCAGGTALDSASADLSVAGSHTVTIRYQDTDGRTLAASVEMEGRPLVWSDSIGPAVITGYTFARWDAGDGVSITDDHGANTKTTTTADSIQVKATYEGTLTAVYNKKKMIYFNNTLGWNDVYVYFYKYDDYWDNTLNTSGSKFASGANEDKEFNSHKPYVGEHAHMTQIEGTNIWYLDYTEETWYTSDRTTVAFTEADQDGNEYFYDTKAVCAYNFDPTNLPMYVPLSSPSEDLNKNTAVTPEKKTTYYLKGYWMNYPNNTGYWLKIFNKIAKANEEDSAPVCIQDIPFEYTGDMTMPMTVTAELDEGVTYGFKIYRNDATWYGNTGTMKSGASGDTGETVWEFTTAMTSNCGLKTSVAGEYKFTLDYAPKSGIYYYLVGVHYPVAANDYRIVYKDLATWSQGSAHTSSWYHPSRAIHKENGAEDIVSFYVSKAVGASASMKFQYASSVSNEGVVTWADVDGGTIDLSGIEKSGVYNFYLTQADGAISVSKIEPYEGNYYIRTDCAGSTKWDNYRAKDHQMTYTEFSKNRSTNQFGDLYTHYYMHWCPRETNVKFVIANDYSMCITDTLAQDVDDPYANITSGGYLKSQKGEGKTEEQDKYSANIRFMYNDSTNRITRAYMSSSTEAARKFLVLRSNTKFTDNGKALNGTGEVSDDVNNIYEAIFEDNQDWIYERTVKVKPEAKFKLYASYAQATAQEDGSQHFRGAYEGNDWTEEDNYVVLIGGSGDSCIVRLVYDFKTNRLMSAYVPEEGDITGTLAINADIMLIRDHQEAGQQLTFANAESALTDVKTVYGVMRFNRWILNNRQHPEDHDKEHSDTQAHINEYHPLITDPAQMKSSSERGLYWISFPFDVKLSEVFGFGTYGTDWVFLGYNGAERAKEGYWQDSEGFWEYIWDRRDTVLAAGHGIVLALDLDRMGAANTSFWANEIQQIELFFPSLSSTTGTIKQTDASVTLASHQCTIDRRTDEEKAAQEANPATHDTNKDRTVVDSHWNLLGVPSYANYEGTLKHLYGVDQDSVISWNSNPETQDLPFLYEWNANDNTYTVQSGNTYTFKAMHAYYVQFAGKVKWTLASATPVSPIVARRTYAEKPQNVEFKLELQQNSKMIDQTFVKLSEDEEVSAGFVFGEDLSKSLNKNKANIYTLIEGYLPTAGNTLPMTEHTMMIPVGVKPAKEGEYTFSMPEGTEGIGVTLIDNEAGIRTNLGLTDYVVTLNAGKIENRFVLEISPIKNTPTGVEAVTGDGLQVTGVRKVMIDGILYIVKDGVIYDARGNRVK